MKMKLLSTLFLSLLFVAGNVFGQNLLTNPGFETWSNGASGPPDGWNVSSSSVTAGQSTAVVHGGSSATLLTWTTTSTVRFQQKVDVDPNTAYEFSFWALDTTAGGRLRIAIRWINNSGSPSTGVYGAYTTDNPDWQQLVTGTQTSPADADSASIEIRMYDVSGGWTGSAGIYVDDASFEEVAGVSPAIVKAYAISDTEVEVLYDLNLPPVDPADYTLSGTANITFSSAVIDGSNPKLLHLSGASSPMTGDLILDTITDAANATDYDFYAGITPIAMLNTNYSGGHLSDNYYATFQGIVSANDNYNNVWFSDASGQRNGVLIYDNSFDALVAVGDEILVTGKRYTYNGLTELKGPELISTVSTGNTPYGPDVIPGSDIDETLVSDTDPGEAWEGQFVKIENFTVESAGTYDYRCSWSDGSNTYYFHIGDNVDYHFNNINLVVGATYSSITGVVDWKNSNFYRINPRSQSDIIAGGAPMIVKAYSLDNSKVELVYDQALTSVNASDYTLTGSNNISFATANVDATDPTIVHLDNPDSGITGDLVIDEIHDAANGANYSFYAGVMPIADLNTTNAGGVLPNGNTATFQGVVYANDGNRRVWISDASGAYNGVLIYDYNFDDLVAVGDEVLILAERDVYNNLTELKNPELLSILSSGNTLYGPTTIAASDIEENIAADTDPAESWEGQFVKIENFTVDSYTNYDYTCSADIGGTTYVFHIGDAVDYHFGSISLNTGQVYDYVQGAVDYKGGTYRINPRNPGDVVGQYVAPTRLVITSVNNGNNPTVNVPFSIDVEVQDDAGNLATVNTPINFNLSTNGGAAGNVGFAAGSTTSGSFAAGENQITLTGIILAPEGTDVNLTADDGTLTPGVSANFDVIAYNAPDLMITEILQNASGSDSHKEWFEIFNNSSSTVNLNGYVVKDADYDSDTIKSDVFIAPQGFVTIGQEVDTSLNGAYVCDYALPGMTLSNGADEIIILTPAGIEVDRVEYDGGPVWPDPNGKSMVFTGTVNDDNNDGTLWIEADLREPSYYYATGDLGSPGTNGVHQQLTGATSSFQLDLKVMLEGAVNGTQMTTSLNSGGYLPNNQPYSGAPWNYSGTESFAAVPNADVVDWVLVQLREATDAAYADTLTTFKTMAGLLLKDGSIVGTDGSSMLSFTEEVSHNLYVVIMHRNHLDVMSSAALVKTGNTYSYDFTASATAAYGTDAQKNVGGIWAMFAGDVDGDGEIDNADDAQTWQTEAGQGAYLESDVNLDGQSDNVDKNDFWFPNLGEVIQLP